jgi:carbon-monoxide dehydrogenase medium subunit
MEYLYPESVEQAIQLLQSGDGANRIIAGGTDILPDIRRGKIAPDCLVDITRIPELAQIQVQEGMIQVGAAVTFSAIQRSPLLQSQVPALVEAANSVGAQAIQNAATWVGNIVQAMPAADGAIVAIALDAEALIINKDGAHWHPVSSLFRGPGVSSLDPRRELVTHIRFPLPTGRWGTAWERIGRRPSLVLPILNCAVKICLAPDADCIESATIALGPVAPQPFRAHQAEEHLRGHAISRELIEHAAQLVQEGSNPRDSVARASRAYRLAVIPTMVEKALEHAIQRAREHKPYQS